ncbi:YkuS family protein [Tumebacillus lipolyticus]|uniref:YkuS family protein n=1 Tax=Tumebacillus lipolyticus TaxID=1280370 RepID=A0ABW4ZY18_9BACL
MNNKRVAVEPNLDNVRDYLSQEGYDCCDLDAENLAGQELSAVVISGTDQNVMGMSEAACQAPVINAHGMRPEEVAQRIQNSAQ